MSGDGYVVVERESMTDDEKALDDHVGEYSRTALELADLNTVIRGIRAFEIKESGKHIGDGDFLRYQGRMEMAREISELIAKRIAVLTGGAN